MPKAYYGQDIRTGWYFAMTDFPFVYQWAETEEEAKKKLTDRLMARYRLTVVGWAPFMSSEPGYAECHNCGKEMTVENVALARVAVFEDCAEKLTKERDK